jgi:lipopolysaccharide/colanic/teichoic acid biosynthesis glycosyltransferase
MDKAYIWGNHYRWVGVLWVACEDSEKAISFKTWQKVKRCLDFTAAIILLPFFLPLMGLISAAIKLDSEGPVIFKQKRMGNGKKEFYCYKFRSMVNHSSEMLQEILAKDESLREQWERFGKLKDYDPRVTRVGRFIRKYSLDELPQIINIIKGDMSFVGPRPYSGCIQGYCDIYKVRPGLTGYWQVNGRNDVEFAQRLEMENWYVKNWSIWLDFLIFFQTMPAVLKAKGVS